MSQAVKQRGISNTWTVNFKEGRAPHIRVGPILEPGRWKEFDPFLLMMEDTFQQGTFDFHPHRGIETATFVIEGQLKHEDNYGGYGVLLPGDVQWMTAGKGIIHSEDPMPGETVHSLQLWINLPKANKMAEPRYQDLRGSEMPVRREEGALIRVFSGASGEVTSSTQNHNPITFVELILEAGASIKQDLPASYNGFIYVLEGSGSFGADGLKAGANQLLWLGSGEDANDSEVAVQADQPLRAILVAGEPIGEPVVAHGPFVMNTQGEIKQAFLDYQDGKFGPNPSK
jgi:redox-sensitive bicupin YhaK (pirin superfamily)